MISLAISTDFVIPALRKTLQIRVDGYACIGINQQDARLNFCWHIVTENVRPYFSKPLFLYQFCECFYKHVNLA